MKIIQIANPNHLYNQTLSKAILNKFGINCSYISNNLLKDLHKLIAIGFYNFNKFKNKEKVIVHFHHFGFGRFNKVLTLRLMMKYLTLLNCKKIWTIHDVVYQENPEEHIGLYKYFYNANDIKIVHSPQALEMIKEFYNIKPDANTYVIPHINFNNACVNQLTKSECRKILNIDDDEIVMLFIGAIRLGKGIIEYLDVCKRLRNLQKIRFIVAGKIIDKKNYGMIYQELINAKKIMSDKLIMYIGYIPDEEMQIYFNSSDFVVIPHRKYYTNSGIIILSFAFNIPVISTYVGGNEYYVDDSCGILVRPENIDELYDACLYMYKRSNDLKQMGINGRRKMELLANEEKVAEMHYNIYLKI